MKSASRIFINIILLFVVMVFCKLNVFAVSNFGYNSSNPRNNEYNVVPDLDKISVSFSYNIDWNYINAADKIILKDSDNNVIQTESEITGKSLDVKLKSQLMPNTKYTLIIPAGVFKATNVNTDYINSPINLYFTTVNDSFSYSSSTPRHKETSVSDNLEYVYFSFADNIYIGNQDAYDKIEVRDTLGNIVSDSADISNNYLNIKIGKSLKPLTTYNVTIPSGALKSRNSNKPYYLYNSDIDIWFTTYGDNTVPYIISPLSNDRYKVFNPNASLTIQFNKEIKLTRDASKITLTNNSGEDVQISLSTSDSGKELFIKPKKSLSTKAYYNLYIPKTAVSDSYSNSLRSNYSFSFSTGIDNDSPKLLSGSLSDGDVNIPIGTDEIELKFSKAIKYSLNYKNISVAANGKNLNILKSVKDDKLYIKLKELLAAGTAYVLTVPSDSVKDYNENSNNSDIVIGFTTMYPPGESVKTSEIKKCDPIEQIEVDAGTPFEDLINIILPDTVNVSLSDKGTSNLQVIWQDSSPQYNEKKPGTYTIKGKIVVSDWILNTGKVSATAKVKVVDRDNPSWPSGYDVDYDDRTENSVKLLWTEAEDDTSIGYYVIDLKIDGVVKKSIKVTSDKASRLSNDISDRNYNTLCYELTGLQSSAYYDAYITAYDSDGKATDFSLDISFRTYAKTQTTKTSTPSKNTNSNSNSNPGKTSNSSKSSSYFDDIGKFSWAKDAIESLAEQGIILGTSKGKFSPANNITRADFVVILIRALDFNEKFSDNFSDVSSSDYYYKSIGIAKKLGIVKGDQYGNFFPEQYVKREDIFVMLKRALDNSELDFDSQGNDASDFRDYDIISDYAVNAVDYLVDAGIVNGDGGYINPKNQATRAEIAVLISSIID